MLRMLKVREILHFGTKNKILVRNKNNCQVKVTTQQKKIQRKTYKFQQNYNIKRLPKHQVNKIKQCQQVQQRRSTINGGILSLGKQNKCR